MGWKPRQNIQRMDEVAPPVCRRCGLQFAWSYTAAECRLVCMGCGHSRKPRREEQDFG